FALKSSASLQHRANASTPAVSRVIRSLAPSTRSGVPFPCKRRSLPRRLKSVQSACDLGPPAFVTVTRLAGHPAHPRSYAAISTLAQRFDYLVGLRQRPVLDDLAGRLEQLDLAGTLEELTPKLRFSDAAYQRILLRESPHYHVWVMCWKNGQRSPIHDHAAS